MHARTECSEWISRRKCRGEAGWQMEAEVRMKVRKIENSFRKKPFLNIMRVLG